MALNRLVNLNNCRGVTRIYSRMMSSTENDVIFDTIHDKGIITLNRPKALNALNLSMVKKILPKLQEWENSKNMVIVKGTGEKAFCSGGDVRAIVAAGKANTLGHEFFRIEYTMNGIIGNYKIPYIAFIHGIVMGGGVGLSVHGKYRIATEKTMFAMPETAIGLFPDVGGSYFLPRLTGKLGTYLALTGHKLMGYDVYRAGIATHACHSSKLKELESALLSGSSQQDIDNTLLTFHPKDIPEFSLTPHLEKINKCFSVQTVEEIMSALKNDGSDWAKATLATLSKMSPTSMKIALKQLEFGAKMSLHDCLKMEYRIACGCLSNNDFYEGVRALLIDKDQKPSWKPSTLDEVTEQIVDGHFKELPDDQELKHKL